MKKNSMALLMFLALSLPTTAHALENPGEMNSEVKKCVAEYQDPQLCKEIAILNERVPASETQTVAIDTTSEQSE